MTTTITPESTTIKKISLNTQKAIAKVVFVASPKTTYIYTGLSEKAAEEIVRTHNEGESMGRAFARVIKPLPFTKVTA